jgi:hypothetical protein
MRKISLILLVLACVSSLAAAQETQTLKLKDVPDDHWAASSVYDLVRLGVTKGYPDGTYRGDKPITRFETAIFLSKLARSISSEKSQDIQQLRDQLVDIKKNTPKAVSLVGSYLGDWKSGNVLASKGSTRGTVGSYRLVLSTGQELNDNSSVKLNLDTMDYGYFDDGSAAKPGRGLLASELLDIESRVKLELGDRPLELKLTYGSGPKQHLADPTGVLPSEAGVTFIRPNTGVMASTNLLGADFALGYFALQGPNLSLSGNPSANQFTGSVAFNLPAVLRSLRVALTGDYVARGSLSASERDVRGKVDLTAPLGEKVQASGTVGMGGSERNSMMVSGALSLNDLLDTGTFVTLRLAKIGFSYINPAFANEEFYFAGYDYFNRPLIGGTVQLGGALTQNVSDRVKLIGKGDIRLNGNYKYEGANARLTAEGGISYNIAPNANLDAAYRIHQDKSTGDTSDLAALGLMYKF